MADRLGQGVLSIVEQLIPWAAQLQDHTELIGRCLIVAFALIVIRSAWGIVRK